MAVLIDTNIAIHIRDQEPAILDRLSALDEPILLSVVSLVELEGGVLRASVDPHKRRASLDAMLELMTVLRFDVPDCRIYSGIVSTLGFCRSKILDRMIAAQAILHDARLATLNPRDFRIPGLSVEDWLD